MTMSQALAHDVIVLAGGFGTRLREVVADVPKPMAPVAGRPFLDHLLQRLALQGASRVILSVGHMAHLIEERYGAGFAGLDITCVREDTPLGTGGGIRKALSAAQTEWVLVINGDTWLDMPYGEFLSQAEQAGAPVAMVTRWVDDAARYGRCVVQDQRIVVFGEKSGSGPGLINAGVCTRCVGTCSRPLTCRRRSHSRRISSPSTCLICGLSPTARMAISSTSGCQMTTDEPKSSCPHKCRPHEVLTRHPGP